MSDKRISELVELTTLAADDELVVVDADANGTKRVTYDTLATEIRTEAEPLTGTTGTFSGDVTLSSGLLKTTNLPAWRVTSTSVTGGSPTPLETTNLNQTNIVDLANNRVVIDDPGIYLVTVSVVYISTSTDYRNLAANILVNGSSVHQENLAGLYHITSATYESITTTTVASLAANDAVTVFASSAPDVYALTFSGVYLG